MDPVRKKIVKRAALIFIAGLLGAGLVAGFVIFRTWGRTVIQVDILQNKEIIHL
jgi:uncharacterized protein involved in exopolysaccharide biosynthesis